MLTEYSKNLKPKPRKKTFDNFYQAPHSGLPIFFKKTKTCAFGSILYLFLKQKA